MFGEVMEHLGGAALREEVRHREQDLRIYSLVPLSAHSLFPVRGCEAVSQLPALPYIMDI